MAERYGRTAPVISPRLLEACERYDWPGNLRELGNFVKRHLILGDEELTIQELQFKLGRQDPACFCSVGHSRRS